MDDRQEKNQNQEDDQLTGTGAGARTMGDEGTRAGQLSGHATGGTSSTSFAGSAATATGSQAGSASTQGPSTTSTSSGGGTVGTPRSPSPTTGTDSDVGMAGPTEAFDRGLDGGPGGTQKATSARGTTATISGTDVTGVGSSTGANRGDTDVPVGEQTASLQTLAAGRTGATNTTPGTGGGGTFSGAGTGVGTGGTNRGIGEPFGESMETQADNVINASGGVDPASRSASQITPELSRNDDLANP